MLTRIVKMTFRETEIDNFKMLFNSRSLKIRSSEGCEGLRLLQDENDPRIFFTLSLWKHDDNLQAYRSSDLFADTWKKTKALFADKPLAWSLNEAVKVELE